MARKDYKHITASPSASMRMAIMPSADGPRLSRAEFAKRVAIVAGITLLTAAFAAFLWTVSRAVLVLFAACLFAVMLDGLTRLVLRWFRLPRSLALTLTIVCVTACTTGILVLGGVRVANQAPELRHNMEQSIEQIQDELHNIGFGPNMLSLGSTSDNKLPSLSKLFSYINGYLSTSVELVTDLLIIIVAGIYFAASPRFYIGTPIMLVPAHRRERLRAVSFEVGHALRLWLIGRFAAMVSVGVLTGIGLTLLQVKLAALLAVIACLLTFIPYLGTIISVIPAVLLGMLNSPMTTVYVVLLYLVAHTLEGYVLSPLIQARTVHLAPGWLILSQLLGGLAAGVFGILIAAPLMVTLTISVQMLYVEDVLGDRVHILGE